ncbi:MAG TPA: bifunctional DNA-formamidopyrimidine glycosylase/DNA-(apurinic or apyrimidinic site) lyase [Acidimicrobiia bacterium]|jgi:formamidopyrimidine-DNA glycosylase
MPELPEVEVLRRDLDREVVGKKIKAVDVDGMRSVRRHHNRKQFAQRLVNHKITGVERKGKYLLLRLDGDDVLVVHLGMSGQLIRTKSSRDPMAKHTHVVITFTQGGQLRFVDPRTFGEMFVTEADTVEKDVTELAHLGIDPLETALSWEYFGQMLAARHAKLKPLLMDQKFIAGIGNIYSDEILWGAGLRWDRMSDALTSEEVRRLYRSMMEILQEAVKHRGSSLADEQYVDLFGRPGEYQQFHNVYAREGQSCPRCRHIVMRERVSGRSTFFCSACQV